MTNANDSAFSSPASEYDGTQIEGARGLSKLEYFAAMAMQGILACSFNNTFANSDRIAKAAVNQAKSLIDELNK